MMNLRFVLTLALIGGFAGCDCSGGSTNAVPGVDSGTPDASPVGDVALNDICGPWAQTICAELQGCLGNLYEIYQGLEECLAFQQVECENEVLPLLVGADTAGRLAYDPTLFAGCLSAIDELGCEAAQYAKQQRWPAACRTAFGGVVAEGAGCTHNWDCADNRICKIPSTCTDREDPTCAEMCAKTCEDPAADGAACATESDCVYGAVCDFSSSLCDARLAPGAACTPSDDNPCYFGYLCGGSSNTCDPFSFTLTAGDSCSHLEPNKCGTGLYCSSLSLTVAGTCTAVVSSGSACTVSIPDSCPSTEYCNGTICTPLPTSGTCADHIFLECAAGYSCIDDTDTCTATLVNGQACTDSDACRSEFCDTEDSGECEPQLDCY